MSTEAFQDVESYRHHTTSAWDDIRTSLKHSLFIYIDLKSWLHKFKQSSQNWTSASCLRALRWKTITALSFKTNTLTHVLLWSRWAIFVTLIQFCYTLVWGVKYTNVSLCHSGRWKIIFSTYVFFFFKYEYISCVIEHMQCILNRYKYKYKRGAVLVCISL